jgi:hypothetical protein
LLKEKTSRPARRLASKSSEQHHSQRSEDIEAASPSKARNANISPAAELCPAPVESDFAWFRRNPTAKVRNRFAFPGEFSAADLDEGGLDHFVHAIVKRCDGGQIRRARVLCFVERGNG